MNSPNKKSDNRDKYGQLSSKNKTPSPQFITPNKKDHYQNSSTCTKLESPCPFTSPMKNIKQTQQHRGRQMQDCSRLSQLTKKLEEQFLCHPKSEFRSETKNYQLLQPLISNNTNNYNEKVISVQSNNLIEQSHNHQLKQKQQIKQLTLTKVHSPSGHVTPFCQQKNQPPLQDQRQKGKITRGRPIDQKQQFNYYLQQRVINGVNDQKLKKIPSPTDPFNQKKQYGTHQDKSKQKQFQIKNISPWIQDDIQNNIKSETKFYRISLFQLHDNSQRRNDKPLPGVERIRLAQLNVSNENTNDSSTLDQTISPAQLNDNPKKKYDPSQPVPLIKLAQLKKQEYSTEYHDYCDCIQLNSTNYFVQSKFTYYSGQFNIETKIKKGNGWFLQMYFDKHFNPSYFCYEGQFNNDQIVGSGKLFNNKSKNICKEGDWSSIQKMLNRHPEIAIKSRTMKFAIKISDDAPSQRISYTTVGFCGQLLSPKDIAILEGNSWLNSNIIDSYIQYLNYQDEIHYWALPKEGRKQYQRLQIFPSSLFTWFKIREDKNNLQYFEQYFLQCEPISYRFWKIYKRIGFIINQADVHWYFVQLDFEKMEILVKDSMRGGEGKYNKTKDILNGLFSSIDENIKFTIIVCQQCKQQENGYDCGAYTCINAKELAEGKIEDINNGREMRNFLINFIQYEVKKD